MLQLAASVLCGYLGWRRAVAWRWPLAIIVFSAVAGVGLTVAGHHDGAGPALGSKLILAALSLIVFPAVAYALLLGVRRALDRRR